MTQPGARPPSIVFENGEALAKIYFVWGHPANPIPKALCVSVQELSTNVIFLSFDSAQYASFSKALERGLDLANQQFKRRHIDHACAT